MLDDDEDDDAASDIAPPRNPVNHDTALDAADGDDDEEADYETEDEGNGEVKARHTQIRMAYMPPTDSPIGKILEATQLKMSATFANVNQMWIPPPNDPSLEHVECIHGCGCGCGKIEKKGIRWRPMFKHGEIIWLLYDRIFSANHANGTHPPLILGSFAMECRGTMKQLCKNYGQFKGIFQY
eukprot:scaffold28784_cov53-Attheya_sp.AAC.4